MIFNIIRKELKSMFASPMGWVILALLMLAFGMNFLNGIDSYFAVMQGAMRPAERVGVTQFIGQKLFSFSAFLALFAVPLLSMRLIAEERRSLTLPFLFSAPVSLTDIVLGKFLGLVIFLSVLVVYIALMMFALSPWADIDVGYILANAFGLILLIASFSAVGLYFSSMTQQPVVAAILTFIALFSLSFLNLVLPSDPSGILPSLSIMQRFQSFTGGIIDTGDIAYFVLLTIAFLTLTIRRLDADRLRG
jgi:ABC-2 type transport system permease protein